MGVQATLWVPAFGSFECSPRSGLDPLVILCVIVWGATTLFSMATTPFQRDASVTEFFVSCLSSVSLTNAVLLPSAPLMSFELDGWPQLHDHSCTVSPDSGATSNLSQPPLKKLSLSHWPLGSCPLGSPRLLLRLSWNQTGPRLVALGTAAQLSSTPPF